MTYFTFEDWQRQRDTKDRGYASVLVLKKEKLPEELQDVIKMATPGQLNKQFGRLTTQKPNIFLYSYKNLESYPGYLSNIFKLCEFYLSYPAGMITEVFYTPPGVEYGYRVWVLHRSPLRAFGSEEEAKHMKILLSLS